jgi:glycosyltransferase involved in cell wall biosynthesis
MDKELAASKIFIIIPVHNRKQITLRCLKHLSSCSALNSFQVIVVDDGSSDGTADAIRLEYPSVSILVGDGKLWWTGAVAKGMNYALEQGASHFIWLNDDCLPQEDTLRNLTEFVDSHPQSIIGLQGFRDDENQTLSFGGKRLIHGYYQLFPCPKGEILPCDMLSGNLVCIPKSVVDKIGLPTVVLPHYGGDTLYLIKARNADFRLFVDGRTTAVDIGRDAALNPMSWMLESGEPLKIIKLFFQPQSILSWRVWWILLTTDHTLLGFFRFVLKYSLLLPKVLLITLLRFLPTKVRQKLVANKKNAKAKLLTYV